MGGGFKQNLNVEVSPERIEREVANYRNRQSSNNVAGGFGALRPSRHVSNNTLDLAINELQNESKIGFNIERATLNYKAGQKL